MDKPIDNTPSMGNSITAFVDRPISRVHKFYLSGEVKPPSEYIQWFEAIRNSNDTDVIVLHINSYGGDLFTAIQFMRVMNESKANIIASVEGACMSAATLIFLAAKNWEISKHTMFMFHNYSSGNFGKGGELYDNIMHERKWSANLWQDIYRGFLTDAEINSILNNKDIWMTGEEVNRRLEAKVKRGKSVEAKAKRSKRATSKKPKPRRKSL